MNESNTNLNEDLNKTLPVPALPNLGQPIINVQPQNLNPVMPDPSIQSDINNSQASVSPIDVKIVDNDLIEKVWVDKIKTIIQQTRGNPFKQSQEINKVKADYMLKEHNRVIKIK